MKNLSLKRRMIKSIKLMMNIRMIQSQSTTQEMKEYITNISPKK